MNSTTHSLAERWQEYQPIHRRDYHRMVVATVEKPPNSIQPPHLHMLYMPVAAMQPLSSETHHNRIAHTV